MEQRLSDAEIVKRDAETLYIGNIRTVEFDLILPGRGENGSVITWETGHDRIISKDGKVTRPKYGMGSRTVPLTATLTWGNASRTKVFEVRVLEEENKIKIESIYPVELKAAPGQVLYLPNAVAVKTEDGRVISHAVEWESKDGAVYDKPGTEKEHGVVAGTSFPVTAGITVEEGYVTEKMDCKKKVSPIPARLEGESHFLQAQTWSQAFLIQVNDDQMLYNFRAAAGLDTKGAPEMIGWDAPDSNLKGHTTGHYLSGLALCYKAAGSERIKEKAEYMIASLKECQDAFSKIEGIHEGFLSGYDETQFDLLERYVRYPEIWAPYYTLHKIFAGLLDCYEFVQIPDALVIADKLGTWVYNRLSRLPREVLMKMWSLYIAGEFGGMNDVLARLYSITGKTEHIKAAGLFDNDKLFFPMSQGIDALDGLHANQHIPQIIGCMKLFEAGREKRYYTIAKNFWSFVTGAHVYAIGGTGEGEMFHEPYGIGKLLSKNTAESCASYNMLKLTRELFMYEPESFYMDYYERTMFNHIASSCDHGPTGASTYFMPLAPGFTKEFDDENSCCHGTGLENHFKYGEDVYYRDGSYVYVNLFVPSKAEAGSMKLIQMVDGNCPGAVTIKIDGRMDYGLKIRRPFWCTEDYEVIVDGGGYVPDEKNGYLVFDKDLNAGEIKVTYPCGLRLEPAPDKPQLCALLYGPYVLAALTEEKDFLNLPFESVNLNEAVVKDKESLRFQYKDITFVPLCHIGHEGYQVYFKIK